MYDQENCMIRSFLICTHKILLADQIEEVIDGACAIHKAEDKHTQDFDGET
jgi:hypothetical protein